MLLTTGKTQEPHPKVLKVFLVPKFTGIPPPTLTVLCATVEVEVVAVGKQKKLPVP